MNNETTNQILKNISKELLNGLFPYVFANTKPTVINNNYNYSIDYGNNDNKITKNNLVASKTRKKIIYKPYSVDWRSICLLNYSKHNINYSAEVYFKNKNQIRVNNLAKSYNGSKFRKISLSNNTLGRRFTGNNITNGNLSVYAKYKEYRSNGRNIRNNIETIYNEKDHNNNYKRKIHNNIKFY